MPDESSVERLRLEVSRRYGVPAGEVRTVFAPYRICPLGAHIDHQLGRVTAMAIDEGVRFAYAPSGSREIRASSLTFPEETCFRLDAVPDKRPGEWGNYLRGAAHALGQEHTLTQGMVGVTDGRAGGGGLSSSAAVGLAFLLALEDVNRLDVSPRENILLDQAIENGYLGLRNGILDQSAILLSRRGHLTIIDCTTVRHQLAQPPASMRPFVVLVAQSGLTQSLVGTDYNRRVAECQEAARSLLAAVGRPADEPRLGRILPEEYETHRSILRGAAARRAAHFFSEMERVRQGVEAWKAGDLPRFGQLMTASGESSIRNYECGCPPMISLYRILVETEGVYGARFSGAGFRGCSIALVDPARAEQAARCVHEAYITRHSELAPGAGVFHCRTDDGARILEG